MEAAAIAAVLDQPRGGGRRRRVEVVVGRLASPTSSSLLAAALLLLALCGPAAEAHGAHGAGHRRALLNAFEPGALQVHFWAGLGLGCVTLTTRVYGPGRPRPVGAACSTVNQLIQPLRSLLMGGTDQSPTTHPCEPPVAPGSDHARDGYPANAPGIRCVQTYIPDPIVIWMCEPMEWNGCMDRPNHR